MDVTLPSMKRGSWQASDLENEFQLASDVRYKAKGKVKEGTNREELKKVYLGLIQSSPHQTL